MEKAIIGMSQQKKAIIKQRLTSSVSIFFISPYFTTKTVPRAAMPTTTIDQPMISHLKKSGKVNPLISNVKIPAYRQAGKCQINVKRVNVEIFS